MQEDRSAEGIVAAEQAAGERGSGKMASGAGSRSAVLGRHAAARA